LLKPRMRMESRASWANVEAAGDFLDEGNNIEKDGRDRGERKIVEKECPRLERGS